MSSMNPLILRELVQSSHHRRTYFLRAALPAAAGIIIVPQVLAVIAAHGYDWRSISNIARPVFATTAWMQLIVFGLLAVVYGIESLQLEWTQRTMELLCTTPISARGIVWGKFVSILCRIFLIGLALLPVMMVWWRMGHIPPALALGSLGVIASSTVMCAALAVLMSALKGKRRATFLSAGLIIVAYFAYVAAVLVWRAHPALVAAAPPWAFYYVMSDSTPQGMGATAFTLLAIAEPLAISALALWAAPAAFRSSFNRFEGGARGFSTGWRGRLARALRRFSSRRPPLGDDQDPFEWQEMGAGTAGLRWSVWLAYVVVIINGCIAYAVGYMEISLLSDSRLYLSVTGIAAGALVFSAALYGVNAFAREKERRTAELLLLTGNLPGMFYRAKLRALYRALHRPLVSVGVVLALAILMGRKGNRPWAPAAWIAAGCVVGPLVAAVVGMTFGAAARSRGQAVAALILSPVLICCAGMTLFVAPPLGAMVILAFPICALVWYCRLPRPWTLWKLSVLLAAVLMTAGLFVGGITAVFLSDRDPPSATFGIIPACLITAVILGLWYDFAIGLFERSMLNLHDRPLR